MDMSKKAYNSPERRKRRIENREVFSNRTPEQQLKDMFKTMDKANKNREHYDPVSFEELQNNIKMRKQCEEKMEQLCDLCGKSYKEHDSRGFIYFITDDKLKAGWSCVEELIRRNKK